LTVDDLDITGTCTGTCSSDSRLKQNVRPLTDALDTLLQFKGVTFEWKNPEEHQNHTGKQTGVIAQDVEKVFPQWVGEDKKGFKTVDPDARTVLALQVEAFRELKARSDAQEERIKALEANRRPLISGLTAEGGLFGIGFVVSRSRRTCRGQSEAVAREGSRRSAAHAHATPGFAVRPPSLDGGRCP
jgi:hypothetical protein